MPNLLDANGLQVATRAELITQLSDAMKSIYGIDINLDSSTPDGQMLNIFVQAMLDMQDMLVQIYNNFDPDLALGVVLDQRVAINGIQRQAGTYTVTNVDVTVTQALNLYGIDQSTYSIFTVADNAGNEFQLMTSQNLAAPGTYTLVFRASTPGAILTIPNTITNQVTIVLGVTAVNNPTTYTTLGMNEESDADLKIRRQKSVALASQGYLSALIAALENINGVDTVKIYENVTASTDGDGVEGHSIWVIIGGAPADASVAAAIYQKRNAGCGLHGSDKTYVITQADSSQFIVKWDVVTTEDLYIKFTVSSLDDLNVPDYAGISSGLVTNLVPALYQQVNVNELATQVQDIDPNTLVTSAGFGLSSSGSFYNSLLPSSKKNQFLVAAARIIMLPIFINSTHSTITISSGVVTTALSIAHSGANEQFTAVGGYGTITFTKFSGTGSITTGGLYTPPGSAGSAVIRATDSLGNYTSVTITIT